MRLGKPKGGISPRSSQGKAFVNQRKTSNRRQKWGMIAGERTVSGPRSRPGWAPPGLALELQPFASCGGWGGRRRPGARFPGRQPVRAAERQPRAADACP